MIFFNFAISSFLLNLSLQMYKNRFVKLLKTFSEQDLKEFERFLHSPYHNRSQQCIDVFDALLHYLTKERVEALSKAALCDKIFKDTKKVNTLEVVLSKLTRLAEEFIVLEHLDRKPYMKKHLLLEELLERQNLEYFKNTVNPAIDKHERTERRGGQFYFERYLLSNNRYKYAMLRNERDAWQNLKETTRALDEFYLIERLKLSYETISFKKLYPVSQDDIEIYPTEELLKLTDIKKNPIVALQHTMLLTIRDEEERYFEELLNLLDKYYLNIPKDELLSLYSIMTNFCVRKIVGGHTNYTKTLFVIYQKQAEQSVLSHGKYISSQLIKNIVSMGAQAGEFDWTEEFLESHTNYIRPEIRNNVYHFNKGALAFYKKDFKAAMDHLNKTDKMDLSFELGRKTVLLRTYYELDESLAFDALCKSFKEYVHSQKGMPVRLKKAYVNFAIVLRKIDGLRRSKDSEKIKNLLEKINKYEYLTNKPWLIEKLKELPVYKRMLAMAGE